MTPLLLTALLAAAAAPSPAPANSVPIGGYTLSSFSQNGTQTPAPSPAPTLSFDGKRASGFSGCNNFSGSYVARANILRFGALAATLRACPDDVNAFEQVYTKLLRGVTRFELTGPNNNQTLTLFSGSNDKLIFKQNAGTGEVANLGIKSNYDGTWTLKSVPANLRPSDDTRPTQFTLRGSEISGFDGCNTFKGQANFSGGRMMFAGPVAATRVFCPPQQASLIPLLTAGASASVKGKVLTLTGADGGQWVFERP
ncbi:META domain-containing protein [Deinococcus sp.]|uniref:META domain-containing protein n=1 Tax=Deinococcus sp. TaxID=47478 RepID=UPI003B59CD9A